MTIGEYSTDLWGKVASYYISPPEVRKKTVEVPGRSGVIDATECLTGYPLYENREIEVDILIVGKTQAEFQTIYDDIYKKIHGKRLKGIMPNDSGYYYIGRWSIDDIVHEHRWVRTIKLKCDAEPYALKLTETVKSYAAGSLVLSSVMPVSFKVVAATATSITRGTTTTSYAVGTTTVKYPLLVGTETITINSGEGEIRYREGKL